MRSPNRKPRKPRDPGRREIIRLCRKERRQRFLDSLWWRIRAKALLELGYADYDAYLRSDLWHAIRSAALERARGICECCRRAPATQVHHRAYDLGTLRGRSPGTLTALCGQCHESAHAEDPFDLRLANKWLSKNTARPVERECSMEGCGLPAGPDGFCTPCREDLAERRI